MVQLLLALALGASPATLVDVAPGAGFDSESFLELDTAAQPNLLVVKNDFWGAELFTVSNGRRLLVVDLCPGPCSSDPEQLTRIGPNQILFLASDLGLASATQLWVSDGTAEGTVKLADVGPDALLIPLDDRLLFTKGPDLWITDGTAAGTAALPWGANRELVSTGLSAQRRFVTVNHRATGRCQLFVSGLDVRQADAVPMPDPPEPCTASLAVLGERAFLATSSGVWRFDGTMSAPTKIDETGSQLSSVGAGLFFFRVDAGELSLFRSTGEPTPSVALGAITGSEGVQHARSIGGRLLYSASQDGGTHLYGSDGTTAGTGKIASLLGPTFEILPVGGAAFVAAGDLTRAELLETDGTLTGTTRAQGVTPFPIFDRRGYRGAKAHPSALDLIGFVVNELGAFRIRPGEEPDSVFTKPANPRSSAPSALSFLGAEAFFTATDKKPAVFRTDGTPEGTSLLTEGTLLGFAGRRLLLSNGADLSSFSLDTSEVLALGPGENPQALTLGEGALLARGTMGRQLIFTDGTPGSQRVLAELGDTPAAPPLPLALGALGVFFAREAVTFSDGTVAGTRTVAVPAAPVEQVIAADALWVVAASTLFRVTPDGAVQVKNIGELHGLTAGEDGVWFFGGPQLWHATADGATQLEGLGLKSGTALAFFERRLMVLGDRGEGQQLFELEGNSLLPRAPAPGARFLHASGNQLFTDVATPRLGRELSFYDPRLKLVLPVGELSPGPGSSSPSPPQGIGAHYVFSAWSPEAGREPRVWTPDPKPLPRGCGCNATGGWLGWALVLAVRLASRRSPVR